MISPIHGFLRNVSLNPFIFEFKYKSTNNHFSFNVRIKLLSIPSDNTFFGFCLNIIFNLTLSFAWRQVKIMARIWPPEIYCLEMIDIICQEQQTFYNSINIDIAKVQEVRNFSVKGIRKRWTPISTNFDRDSGNLKFSWICHHMTNLFRTLFGLQ